MDRDDLRLLLGLLLMTGLVYWVVLAGSVVAALAVRLFEWLVR